MEKKVLSGAQLAGGNSASEKAENDFYATDPKTVDIFLQRAIKDNLFSDLQNEVVWECACGDGNISKKIREYYPSSIGKDTDLVYRGYGEGSVDFLVSSETGAKMIVTNPPFSLMNDFIKKGLELTSKYLVLFAKIQTLETVERKKILENSPLKYVYVHSARQATWKDGKSRDPNGKKWATTMFLAWFVWDKTYTGEPVIRFL